MCRNIRLLHHFEPPTTESEIRAAALQYARKVSGIDKPSRANEEALAHAVDELAEVTARFLAKLPPRGQPRTRDGEREKAKLRFARRARA